jgi:hypothetical protein
MQIDPKHASTCQKKKLSNYLSENDQAKSTMRSKKLAFTTSNWSRFSVASQLVFSFSPMKERERHFFHVCV